MASVGSQIDPPRLISLVLSSSATALVFGREGKALHLGDHERVAARARGDSFTQPGSSSLGAGQSVVYVDAFGLNSETQQRVTLGGGALLIGGGAGAPDK